MTPIDPADSWVIEDLFLTDSRFRHLSLEVICNPDYSYPYIVEVACLKP